MKNKYTSVSDSEESLKTLTDEKLDTHSADSTPPPYSAPNKFIDLEMADGSTQHSAQESTNNIGSDSTYSKWVSANIFFFFASLGYIGAYGILLVMFFYFKVPVRTQDFWGLFGGFIGAISLFLYSMSQYPKEWFKQTGRVLSYLFSQICSVLPNMCVAVICTASLNVVGFVVYRTTDTRQLRIFIADLGYGMGSIGYGMGSIGNGMGNSIRNAANYVRPTDPENEAPRNEEIELQPLAEQSAEV
ncbi:uncharacterized protein SOCG_01491 [Schizosaccharomyces octosporus yFS286]|uniref:Uncharacterized protein n=1 Tax=Schizosaccharomyces octosporus (strain yFS286) TaxID=483514 RepID=S9PTG7_SCHOY|nr:uncharacterized protein SOCG_01491 [Schizosaccharomyces octosporus yFS286]EPX71272.1 hypothetical protein SOCG_01491 [Schizosaccharomyces octosporus yFS286]